MYHVGDRFDRLVVIGLSRKTPKKYFVWCKCDCGNIKEICTSDLISGRVHSCGCLRQEFSNKRTQNKIKNVKLHYVWGAMRKRCNNPNDKEYKNYGGRGIEVCDEWSDRKCGYRAFEKWAIENGYKFGLSIDRINNEGDYTPKNCRWVDWKTQCNNKRVNRWLIIGGKKLTLKQVAEKYNIKYDLLRGRLNAGWSIESAINIPKQKSRFWSI